MALIDPEATVLLSDVILTIGIIGAFVLMVKLVIFGIKYTVTILSGGESSGESYEDWHSRQGNKVRDNAFDYDKK